MVVWDVSEAIWVEEVCIKDSRLVLSTIDRGLWSFFRRLLGLAVLTCSSSSPATLDMAVDQEFLALDTPRKMV
jgi:hypothetical protein